MNHVMDFYPLSPMQEGMLFHTLLAPNSGVYVTQLSCAISGSLNTTAFKQAWQQVTNQHSILRSFFVWKNLKKPIQVVEAIVDLPIEELDWRNFSSSQQQQRLDYYIDQDRIRGFELSKAPLMRLALIQLADHQYHLVWTHHHLLLDGWSISLLFKDLFAYYESLSREVEIHHRAGPSYRDYITWLQKQDLPEAEAFWRRLLKGLTAPTQLPSAHLRVEPLGHARPYDKQQLQLSLDLTNAMHRFGREHQLTLNTLMLATWALLLARHSGQEDVVFGTVVSGRPYDLAGAETMIGLFINTLPVRARVSDSLLLPWLKELQDHQVLARQFEYSPLLQVQGWSDVPRRQPLFESVVVYENYPMDISAHEQVKQDRTLDLSRVRVSEQANFPLSLMVVPGQQLALKILYDCRRFDSATVTRLLSQCETLLKSMIGNAQQSVSSVSMLTDSERQQILVSWNDTRQEYPLQSCIHTVIEEQAERSPEAVALVAGSEQVSYSELNRRSNKVAHYLRSVGVGAEVRVAVLMERSVEMIVGLLGILKSGGAYVPLDPLYPQERLRFMVEDSGAAVVITQQHLRGMIAECGAHVVCVDDGETIEDMSEGNPANWVDPDNLAYVIYTSGSTGRPKGVQISHRALLNLVYWHRRYYNITSCDRSTQIAGVAFDASVWELWPYLATGASIYMPDDSTRSAPELLRDWLIAYRITISFLPTPLAESVLSLDWPDEVALRALLTGGDKLHARSSRKLPFSLFNNYGPTENAVVATSCLVTTAGRDDKAPPIGRPIDNVRVYLLDERLQPAPVGVPGELYVGGASLSRGYNKRAELTSELFIPDPFSDNDIGERLYKTGDMARYLENGEIEYLERIDHQVKIRGFRVELGEVEFALAEHSAVREAIVIATQHDSGGNRLVGYIITHMLQSPSASALRRFLLERLPDHMVPSAFVILEKWPMTPNGKLDRKALPLPGIGRPTLEVKYVPPHNKVERAITQIWQEVLHLEKVGVNDNFFDLGGHSLLMLQVHSKVQEALGKEVSLIDLFEYPTINSMSNHFTQRQPAQPSFDDAQRRANRQKEALAQQKQRLKERHKAV